MPNRCGMIHVRGPIPPNRITHGEGRCSSLFMLRDTKETSGMKT